jgi:hypothetical protein
MPPGDFPAFCGRCQELTPHNYPQGSAAPPHCMRCTHGPGYPADYPALTPAMRMLLMSARPEDAARIAKAPPTPPVVVYTVCVLVGLALTVGLVSQCT